MSEWIEYTRPGRVEQPTKSIFRNDGSSAELSVSRHPSCASDEPRESLIFHVSGRFDVDAMEQAVIEAFKRVAEARETAEGHNRIKTVANAENGEPSEGR